MALVTGVQTCALPIYTWVSPDGTPFVEAPKISGQGTLNMPAAQAIFAGAKRSLDAVLAEADKKGARPKGFALKTTAHIRSSSTAETITSPNVAAMLPGSDPSLKNQYRSEEHTSELQSLMRISYAVFCLKKKQ